MDPKQELMELLTATFVAELDERVQALSADLLALEKQPGPEERTALLTTLFRAAHSLKGAARSVSLTLIESACHALEDILTGVRDGRLPLSPPLFSLLFSGVDAVTDAGGRLRDRRDLAGAPLEALLPRLEQAARGEAVRSEAGPVPPRATAEPTVAVVSPPVPPAIVRTPVAETRSPAAAATGKPLPAAVSKAGGAKVSTVRVAADKLDALLAQSGELLVARRRVESRAAELERVRELVHNWTREWRNVEVAIRGWLQPREREGAAAPDERRTGRITQLAAASLSQEGARLRRLEGDLERLTRTLVGDARALRQAAALLEGEVHRVRMLPFGDGCQGLERAVRDVALAEGKDVELVLEGVDVEVDRSILEELRDPLLHLVRNAVDHGLETPAQRQAAGKPPRAKITVSAALRGSQMEVVVADDGRGLDMQAIREKAIERNLPVPQDDRELTRVLFLPGFSTAPVITEVSGRGVGLDVVKSRIESLRGSVEIVSEPGHGTRFVLTVPLTLTTIAALLLRAGGQTLALPSASVRLLVRFRTESVRRVGGREVLLLGEAPISLASLAGTLGWPEAESTSPGATTTALVVRVGEREIAFVVDEVLEEQVIVVKNLGARIRRLPHVAGATLLPSGTIAVLLNAASLLATAHSVSAATRPVFAPATVRVARRRLLVADDSVTTRTLVKSILESHDYEVVTAADGQDAWDRLQQSDFDLLVSDVEMPGMNGFDLTEAVRRSQKLAKLPVVLVTAREAEADKARGIEVGADAYLVKSGFDQSELLQTVAQLL